MLGNWGAFPQCKASLHTLADVPALLPQLRLSSHDLSRPRSRPQRRTQQREGEAGGFADAAGSAREEQARGAHQHVAGRHCQHHVVAQHARRTKHCRTFQQTVAEEVSEVLLVATASAMPSPSTRGPNSAAQMQGGHHVLTNMMQKGSVRTILTERNDVPVQVHTRAYVPTLMVITHRLTNARQAITHCMRQVVCYP